MRTHCKKPSLSKHQCCLFYLSLSQSQYSNILSLSKSLSPLKKLLLSYSLTLLWSYNNGTTGEKSLSLTKLKIKKHTWRGRGKVNSPVLLLFLLHSEHIQADKSLFGHQFLILRRNEADAQKYLQYSHRIPGGSKKRRSASFLSLSPFFFALTKLNLYHPPLILPHSLFFCSKSFSSFLSAF